MKWTERERLCSIIGFTELLLQDVGGSLTLRQRSFAETINRHAAALLAAETAKDRTHVKG